MPKNLCEKYQVETAYHFLDAMDDISCTSVFSLRD